MTDANQAQETYSQLRQEYEASEQERKRIVEELAERQRDIQEAIRAEEANKTSDELETREQRRLRNLKKEVKREADQRLEELNGRQKDLRRRLGYAREAAQRGVSVSEAKTDIQRAQSKEYADYLRRTGRLEEREEAKERITVTEAEAASKTVYIDPATGREYREQPGGILTAVRTKQEAEAAKTTYKTTPFTYEQEELPTQTISGFTAEAIAQESKPPTYEQFKEATSTVTEAPKEKLKIFGFETGLEVTPSYKIQESAQQSEYSKPGKSAYLKVLTLGTGVFEGFTAPIRDPIGYVKGIKDLGVGLVTDFKKTTTEVIDQARGAPESFLGQLGGQALLFKTIEVATPQTIKSQIPKVTLEETTIPVEGGGGIKVKALGVQAGSRGTTIVTKVSENRPAIVEVLRGEDYVKVSTSQARELPFKVPEVSEVTYTFGKPKPRITPSELASPVPTPVSVGAAKAQESVLSLTPEEVSRIRSASKVSEALQSDKGLRVKQPEFKVEVIPEEQRAQFSRVVDKITGEEGGVYFGSGTTQQLPEGFQNVKIGDVDVIFPKRTSEAITGEIIPRYVKELTKEGIDLRQSKASGSVVETPSGAKVLEAKSGINPEALGEDIALAGFSGVRFADIKKGQSPDTVNFGEAKAITAGEQTARKGAASSFVNPPLKVKELPEPFQEGGVFGKVRFNEPRTLKDVAGFLQGAEGLITLRTQRNILSRLIDSRSTVKAIKELEKYKSTFTKEQLAVIEAKKAELTGQPQVILSELTAKNLPKKTPEVGSPSVKPLPQSPTPIISPSPSISPIQNIKAVEASPSPSPVSKSSSPIVKSASISPVSSPSPRIVKSASISPSPSTKSAGFTSSSPIESPSPLVSSSPSPVDSPSPTKSPPIKPPKSPSPSITRSPPISPVPPRTPTTPPVRTPKPRREESKPGVKFDVEVRRGGVFKRFSLQGLRLEQAATLAQQAVETTAARSFRIFEAGTEKPIAGEALGKFEKLLRPGRFRRSKKDKDVFVEKSKFAINTAGEKIEISPKRGVFGFTGKSPFK